VRNSAAGAPIPAAQDGRRRRRRRAVLDWWAGLRPSVPLDSAPRFVSQSSPDPSREDQTSSLGRGPGTQCGGSLADIPRRWTPTPPLPNPRRLIRVVRVVGWARLRALCDTTLPREMKAGSALGTSNGRERNSAEGGSKFPADPGRKFACANRTAVRALELPFLDSHEQGVVGPVTSSAHRVVAAAGENGRGERTRD